MKQVLGLLLTCAFVPALYAGGMYYLVTHHVLEAWRGEYYAIRAALLIALPLLVSGAVKWWDVWVNPAPKLGGYWSPAPPSEFAVRVFRGHAIVAVVCIALQLLIEQYQDKLPIPIPKSSDIAATKAELVGLPPVTADDPHETRDRRYALEAKLIELEKQKEAATFSTNVPLGILVASALFTSAATPRRPRQQSGHPITEDEG